MNAGKFFLLWFFILLAASVEAAGSPEEPSPRRPNPLKMQTDLAKEIDYLSRKLENLKVQKASPEAMKTVAQKMIDAGDRLSALTDGARGIDLRKQAELYKLTGDKKKSAAAQALLDDDLELDSLNKKFRQAKTDWDMMEELQKEMDEVKKMKPSRAKQLALQELNSHFGDYLVEMSDPKKGIALVRDIKNPESVVNLAELEDVKKIRDFINRSEQETSKALLQKRRAAAVQTSVEKISPAGKAGRAPRLLSGKGLRVGLGVGVAAATMAIEAYVHRQLSDVNDKIAGGGEEPFSRLRPILWGASAVKVSAGFTKDQSPLPDTIDMKVTVTPPKNGMCAMAIPLNGMPENFNCDIDVNGKGFGNSTWAHGLKPVLGCIVFRGEDPLEAGKTTTVIVHFPVYWEYVERYGFSELADPINRVMEKLLKMPLNNRTVQLAGIPRSRKPADPE